MKRKNQVLMGGAALAICGWCGSCGAAANDSCEARLPATVPLDEPDSSSAEPCRLDLNFDVASFPDHESALCQWRETVASELGIPEG